MGKTYIKDGKQYTEFALRGKGLISKEQILAAGYIEAVYEVPDYDEYKEYAKPVTAEDGVFKYEIKPLTDAQIAVKLVNLKLAIVSNLKTLTSVALNKNMVSSVTGTQLEYRRKDRKDQDAIMIAKQSGKPTTLTCIDPESGKKVRVLHSTKEISKLFEQYHKERDDIINLHWEIRNKIFASEDSSDVLEISSTLSETFK